MFLVNVITLDMIHVIAGMIFPPYFFEIGYAGNEGKIASFIQFKYGIWDLDAGINLTLC